MRQKKRTFVTYIQLAFVISVAASLLGFSTLPPGNELERIRAYTRGLEFDYIEWTLDAFGSKIEQNALQTSRYLSPEAGSETVLAYLELVREIQTAEWSLNNMYTDPNVDNPDQASRELRQQLSELRAQSDSLGPVAEQVLQAQIAQILADSGLTLGGQPLPNVLYRATPLPFALIISPREVIQQTNNISLRPDLTLEERIAIEEQVAEDLNVSALVVNIGGVGTYPTMVARTSNINWLAEVVAHEWIHNYLTLRPLGMLYMESPELRTMNETVASIAGKELGSALIERYYPAFVPPPPPPLPDPDEQDAQPAEPPTPPPFDFYAEMRETRVRADELLADGQIEEAEAYMEARRKVFWDAGYRHIRKLNQAYFAFHGAYADVPGGGAAGADPVGEAIRQFRAQSSSLADFVNAMSWFTTFDDLLTVLRE